MKLKIKRKNSLLWVFESIEGERDYIQRKLFGCEAAYFNDRMMLVVADSEEEPWNGLMVPTEREFHESLCKDFPALSSHPILGKWLYLSQSHPKFESYALALATLVRKRDPRIGVQSKGRKSTRKSKAKF